MATEFGIFSDEGKIVGGFFNREEAEAFEHANYSAEDETHVAECCHDHAENEAESCEDCNSNEDEE